MNNYERAIAALNARTNYEASGAPLQPSLDRMQALADLLDHPQKSFPAIHVTGTNGKGTTVAVASALLRETELAVGTYTSPHLVTPRERIAYDLKPISEKEFAETYAYLAPFLDQVDAAGSPVTWFEALTAMSWVYFAERAVDAAVVEVGMGGEWDATNLIDGRVSVVTSVALDHRELGDTTVEVATEKSGIIKHGAICLTADPDPDIIEVLRRRCAKEGAVLRRAGAEFALERRAVAFGGQSIDVRTGDTIYRDVFVPLYGEALATDAALGLAAVSAFLGDRPLDEEIVGGAFATVSHPGRVEVLGRKPLVVVDGAHNEAAAKALVAAVTESFSWEQMRLVIGMLEDHFTHGFLRALLPLAQEVVVTQPDSPRAMPAGRLADEIAALGSTCRVVEDVREACRYAAGAVNATDAVLVTGSLYVVADARAELASRQTAH